MSTVCGATAETSERDAAALDALVAKHKWHQLPPEEAGEAATPVPGERWYFIAPLEELVRSKNIKEPLSLDCMPNPLLLHNLLDPLDRTYLALIL